MFAARCGATYISAVSRDNSPRPPCCPKALAAAVFAVLCVVASAVVVVPAASPAAAQGYAADVAVRDRLIAAQENLLNAYRCLYDIDTGDVAGGCDGTSPASQIEPGPPPPVPTQADIDARDTLVAAQESLLNAYRCLFDIDTERVPGGCVNGPDVEGHDGGPGHAAPGTPADDGCVDGVYERGGELYEVDCSLVSATPIPEDVAEGDHTEWAVDPATGVPVVTRVSSQGSTSGQYVTPDPVDYIPGDDPDVVSGANDCISGIYEWARSGPPGWNGLPLAEALDMTEAEAREYIVDQCMIHIEQLAPFVKHYGIAWACALAGTGDLASAGGIWPNGLRGNWWDCPNIAWDCADGCDPAEKVRQAGLEGELTDYLIRSMLKAQRSGDRLKIEGEHLGVMVEYFKALGLPVPVWGS